MTADQGHDNDGQLTPDYFERFAASIADNSPIEPETIPSIVVPFDSPLRSGQPTAAEVARFADTWSPVPTRTDPAPTMLERTQRHHAHVAAGLGSESAYQSGQRQLDALGYDARAVGRMGEVVRSTFVGLANPWILGEPEPGSTIIDLGCGSGGDLDYITGRREGAFTAIGIDATFEMLTVARTIFSDGRRGGLAQADALRLPIADRAADFVVANGLLCLIADRSALFEEIWRVLAPGGEVRIADIAADTPHRVSELPLPTRLLIALSDRHPAIEWNDLLSAHGFVDVNVSEPQSPFSSTFEPGWLRSFTWSGRRPADRSAAP